MKSLIEVEIAGGLQAHNKEICHPTCPQLVPDICIVFRKSLQRDYSQGGIWSTPLYKRCQDCKDFQDQVEGVVKDVEVEEQKEIKQKMRLPKLVWDKKKK